MPSRIRKHGGGGWAGAGAALAATSNVIGAWLGRRRLRAQSELGVHESNGREEATEAGDGRRRLEGAGVFSARYLHCGSAIAGTRAACTGRREASRGRAPLPRGL